MEKIREGKSQGDQCYGPVSKDNWKHRSIKMKCLTCMWWVEKKQANRLVEGETAGLKIGSCRKNAPKIDGWPAVFETDCCFDHKLDKNKI